MDKLLLGVSFLGFGSKACNQFATWMGAFGRDDCDWEVVAPQRADVWCVNADVVEDRGAAGLNVRHRLADATVEALDLRRAPGLLAVSSEQFNAVAGAVLFDPGRQASVVAAFRTLESRLGMLRCDYALGCSLAWHQEEVAAGGVYQLIYHSRLMAVVDLRRRVAGFPLTATPGDLLRAEWIRRPTGAGVAPDSFVRRATGDLIWTYAVRTRLDILPTRYRRKPVHFCQMPRIAIEQLEPAHIRLLAALRSGPMLLNDLAKRLAAPEPQVCRWLAALHAVEAVSVAPPPAPAAVPRGDSAVAIFARPPAGGSATQVTA
ncbi:MAG: hypothetical protein KA335_11630 [Ramlibacter sp.]|nr:hypothetical protein [Ramlibacter sp.]